MPHNPPNPRRADLQFVRNLGRAVALGGFAIGAVGVWLFVDQPERYALGFGCLAAGLLVLAYGVDLINRPGVPRLRWLGRLGRAIELIIRNHIGLGPP